MPNLKHLRVVPAPAPAPISGNLSPTGRSEPPRRRHLVPDEVERLIVAAGKVGRHGHRDSTMIFMAYRHGLRVSELISLRWEQIDFKTGAIHVGRLKNGVASTHPLRGRELRALRRLQRESEASPYIFISERKGPLSDSAVRKMVATAGRAAKIEFHVHPHQLRHACGFKLANDGQDTRAIQSYLGHRSISNTAVYTALSATRFRGFWSD